jgi:hypothetical protein
LANNFCFRRLGCPSNLGFPIISLLQHISCGFEFAHPFILFVCLKLDAFCVPFQFKVFPKLIGFNAGVADFFYSPIMYICYRFKALRLFF